MCAQIGIASARRVLEVGCGTGAVLTTLPSLTAAETYGLDIRLDYLTLTQHGSTPSRLTCGDAFQLPFASGSFDVCLCHFLLLWLRDPLAALQEMRRVTRRGGFVAALAEPDYGGRIDHPDSLEEVGRMQMHALRAQGADPRIGRSLGSLLRRAGLANVQTGLPGGHWSASVDADALGLEWQGLRADLTDRLPVEDMQHLQDMDAAARSQGERILFVPTFYAWGNVR